LIIIGGGEHARVIADAVRSQPARYELRGYVDPSESQGMAALGVGWLGDDDAGLGLSTKCGFVVGVGPYVGSTTRARVIERYARAGVRFVSIVHGSATVSAACRMGSGVAILANAIVNCGATLGDQVVVNSGAIVEHDAVIGPMSHIGPGAMVGGGTRIGARSQVGMGACVRDHIVLGEEVVVGMGAVVVRSHPGSGRLMGVPARPSRP
jgi:sugar O-acyltransferase (sialic acid O-acetyltransferase NeuD family)